MSPVVDLTTSSAEPPQLFFVPVAQRGRRRWANLSRCTEEREQREIERPALERASRIEFCTNDHPRREKLRAAYVRDFGERAPAYPCEEWCSICHPGVLLAPVEEQSELIVNVHDLRKTVDGFAIPSRPTGKKGVCRICKQRCPKRFYYHQACRLDPTSAVNMPHVLKCGWCQKPLAEGKLRWCNESCRGRHNRARARKARR